MKKETIQIGIPSLAELPRKSQFRQEKTITEIAESGSANEKNYSNSKLIEHNSMDLTCLNTGPRNFSSGAEMNFNKLPLPPKSIDEI